MKEIGTYARLSFEGHDVYLVPSREGTSLLYAPTLRRLIRISLSLADRLLRLGLTKASEDRAVTEVQSMLRQGLTRALRPFEHRTAKSRYFHLALGLTRSCSLACLYCHAEAGPADTMSQSLMEDALQNAFACASLDGLQGVNISFAVGGEPTTRWSLFKRCVQEARRLQELHGLPSYLSITTNGFYGQEKRKFITENFDSILLSLDGPEFVQDKHRPTSSGRGSFAEVLGSGKYFASTAKSLAFRATVSNFSVNLLTHVVEFFAESFGRGVHLVLEPLVPIGRAEASKEVLGPPSQEAFVQNYILAREHGKKLGIEVRTSAAQVGRLVTSFCGAMSIPSFTVTTQGIVTTCERDVAGKLYGYGSYLPESGKFAVDEQAVQRNAQRPGLLEKCDDCFCKWHCAGDCPDIHGIGYDRCFVNRSLVQHELETMIDASSRHSDQQASPAFGA